MLGRSDYHVAVHNLTDYHMAVEAMALPQTDLDEIAASQTENVLMQGRQIKSVACGESVLRIVVMITVKARQYYVFQSRNNDQFTGEFLNIGPGHLLPFLSHVCLYQLSPPYELHHIGPCAMAALRSQSLGAIRRLPTVFGERRTFVRPEISSNDVGPGSQGRLIPRFLTHLSTYLTIPILYFCYMSQDHPSSCCLTRL